MHDAVGKVALPPPPSFGGRFVHEIWPLKPKALPLDSQTQGAIAANETASATGDPHIVGGDGGRFDFQGQPSRVYNLLNDTGLQINALFKAWPGGGTAIGQLGLIAAGAGGYSRIGIGVGNGQQISAHVNGRPLFAGQSIRLADGGTLHLSRNGQSAFFRSAEGYLTQVQLKGSGARVHLDVNVRTSALGVAQDGQLPGGLLGHTFDADAMARDGAKGRNAQGEGAIDGHYTDYEVLGGLFGPPQPSIIKAPLLQIQRPMGATYGHYFNLNPEASFSEVDPMQIEEQWQQVSQDMMASQMADDARLEESTQRNQSRKIELLMIAALNSGNIDLAVLMLSAVETNMANDLTRQLVTQIHSLQKRRQDLSTQMSQLGKADNQESASQLQSLVTQASGIGTEISLLQTFLQDAIASKRNTQEFASNWIRQSHETARSIIQNIGR